MKSNITNYGFVRVATAVPKMQVGNVDFNVTEIKKLATEATKREAAVISFPELCLTGYTLGDLFHQELVLKKALKALEDLKFFSINIPSLICVGLPLALEDKLFNVAALISNGKILGIVPKTYIPGYKEFYEERWFASGRDLKIEEINLFGEVVPIGTDMLFNISSEPKITLGIEICEDLWMPLPPSSFQALAGANVILNLSASNELVGKASYRRDLISQQSARGVVAYIYSSCGVHESTTDVVFSGHALIAENGSIIKESTRFQRISEIIYGDLDIAHLITDRQKSTSFGEGLHETTKSFRLITPLNMRVPQITNLNKDIPKQPFVPQDKSKRNEVAREIFNIQSAGLAKRLEHAKINKIVLGLSGGLDSTLALLVAIKAFSDLGLKTQGIHTFSLPSFGTSKRTKNNAEKLAQALGCTFEEVNIEKGCQEQLALLKHSGQEDVTYENTQARYRTMFLMNKANQIEAIVLGTGDLSEIALGWCTFTGDQISHYHVNSGVPKTLVKYLIEWVSDQKEFIKARQILNSILATPISPELTKPKNGQIAQKTEEIIGPYELHDFFLYHFVRWGSEPKKILFLANYVFKNNYKPTEIKKWLTVFIKRFFNNQWKRSVMPDGPKVGSVSLSPRGDWRMPSDAEVALWIKELS